MCAWYTIQIRLLLASNHSKRLFNIPNTMVRNSIVNNILKIILEVDKYGSYKSWAHISNNELIWSILVSDLICDNIQPYNYSLKRYSEVFDPKVSQ